MGLYKMTATKNQVSPIYIVEGMVIHGRGRGIGKLVGMPTANLKLNQESDLPGVGVYVARALIENKEYFGITHIGMRPTIDNDTNISVETHLLNFNEDIYGRVMKVWLYKKLRDPSRFDNLSLLLEQIRLDCLEVQDFWEIDPVTSQLTIDIRSHRVMVDGRDVYFSSKEFDVLYMLYSNPDVTFTKKQIYEAVWHEPAIDFCHAVENTVFQIRKRIKKCANNTGFIKTVVGYGYRFALQKE